MTDDVTTTGPMIDLGSLGVVVGMLLACLVALVLVLLARREADLHRERARQDVESIRAEAHAALAEAQRRDQRSIEREREIDAAEREAKAIARDLGDRQEAVRATEAAVAAAFREAQRAARDELEAVSGLSADEARAELVRRVTDDAQHEAAALVRRADAKARRTADARARRILTTAVQRLAAPTSAQAAVTIVPLPSDDMKGRVIGKEGRNIRTFEAVTGVDVVIEDATGSVVLSSFDVERREIAQVALEALLADGRIHPQRIEAAYADALAGADDRADAAGHEAAEEAGVGRLHPELVRTLGRLRLRTSAGQNVLRHLVESAQIAGALAAEVGADEHVARRSAFLHDIGKAFSGTVPGTHAAVGAALAERCGEDPVVVNAIAAHHDEVPPETVEAVLVQAADACSAARPGARHESAEAYGERIERVERLVAETSGVRKALAMAAGREIRVVVEPDEVADHELGALATKIARAIEAERAYPGEVTVTVIRELRASATIS